MSATWNLVHIVLSVKDHQETDTVARCIHYREGANSVHILSIVGTQAVLSLVADSDIV
jgi:hypothetical protein